MTQPLVALIGQYGLLVVAACVLAEQLGLPVPALPVLLVAGALAAAGQLSAAAVIAVSLIAATACDLLWYWAGRRYGAHLLRGLCRISLSPDSCVHHSEQRFQRWGGNVLVFAKFVPGLSLVAPPLAGATGLRIRTFLVLDGLGSLLWTALGVGIGYAFGAQVDHLIAVVAAAGKLTLAIVLALLVAYVVWKWLRRRRVRKALAVPRIGVRQLARDFAHPPPPVVIDVRSDLSRGLDPRIIRGALLADAEHIDAALRGVAHDREVVTYCNCPHEATSARAARIALARGYRNVHPLEGGLTAWAAANLPMDRAAAPPAPGATGRAG